VLRAPALCLGEISGWYVANISELLLLLRIIIIIIIIIILSLAIGEPEKVSVLIGWFCFSNLTPTLQYVKCGFAGENFPTSVFPCVVGRPLLRYEESLQEQELTVWMPCFIPYL
jgi:hypothetical protein